MLQTSLIFLLFVVSCVTSFNGVGPLAPKHSGVKQDYLSSLSATVKMDYLSSLPSNYIEKEHGGRPLANGYLETIASVIQDQIEIPVAQPPQEQQKKGSTWSRLLRPFTKIFRSVRRKSKVA